MAGGGSSNSATLKGWFSRSVGYNWFKTAGLPAPGGG